MSRKSRYCDHFIYVSMALFAFLLPLSFAASRGALVLALLVWSAKILFEKKLNWERTPADFALLVFMAAGLISAIFGADPAGSLAGMGAFWTFLIIYALFNNVYDAGRVKVLVSTLFAGAALAALNAGWHGVRALAGGHAFGLTGDAARAGQFMLVCGLASACFLYRKPGRERAFFLLFAVSAAGAAVLQFNRGAWAGLLVLFTAQGALLSPKKTGFALVAVLSFCVLFQPARDRLLNCAAGARAAMRTAAPAVMREYPMGAGLNNAAGVIHGRNSGIPPGRVDGPCAPTKNSYLRILVELGPLGLGAFAAFAAVFLRVSLNLFRRIPEKYPFEKGFALGGFSSFAGFLASGLMEDNFGGPEVAVLIFFVIGLTFIIDRKMRIQPPPPASFGG